MADQKNKFSLERCLTHSSFVAGQVLNQLNCIHAHGITGPHKKILIAKGLHYFCNNYTELHKSILFHSDNQMFPSFLSVQTYLVLFFCLAVYRCCMCQWAIQRHLPDHSTIQTGCSLLLRVTSREKQTGKKININ